MTVLSSHYAKLKQVDDESDDDLITLTRKDHDVSDDETTLIRKKKGTKVERAKDELGFGKKLVFDDDGNIYDPFKMESVEEFVPSKELVTEKQKEFLSVNAEVMKKADAIDKDVAKAKRREIKKIRKMKEKAIRREESGYHLSSATLDGKDSDFEDSSSGEQDANQKRDLLDADDLNVIESNASDSDDFNTNSNRIFKRQKLESMEQLALELMK